MKPINEVDIDEMMRRNERAGRVYFAPAQMRAHKSTILDTRAIEHGTLFIDRTKDPYLGTQYKVKIQIQTGIVWPGNIANEPTLNAARRALAETPNDYNPEEE